MDSSEGVDTLTETEAETSYLVYPMPDDNQAESLASYLTRHGRDAAQAGNEVTVPIKDAEDCAGIYQMHAHWRLFWRYSERELYGLPAYAKPACQDHQ